MTAAEVKYSSNVGHHCRGNSERHRVESSDTSRGRGSGVGTDAYATGTTSDGLSP